MKKIKEQIDSAPWYVRSLALVLMAGIGYTGLHVTLPAAVKIPALEELMEDVDDHIEKPFHDKGEKILEGIQSNQTQLIKQQTILIEKTGRMETDLEHFNREQKKISQDVSYIRGQIANNN